MSRAEIERVARAVLYEGYVLYPYRPSALKNRHRWTFGCLYPPAYCAAQGGLEPSTMRAECLVTGTREAVLEVSIRFLHLLEREGDDPLDPWGAWREAAEREVAAAGTPLGSLCADARRVPFRFPAGREDARGVARRREAVAGSLTVAADDLGGGVFRLRVDIVNESAWRAPAGGDRHRERADAQLRALVSTHAILGIRGGRFISAQDPPEGLREQAAACRSERLWPILVGAPRTDDAMLCAPIILHDHPEVAEESAGDLFDATEIDEILTLRILTLTPEERAEACAADPRAKGLIERTEALSAEDLLRLHGALRSRHPVEAGLRPGARVRLRPTRRSDVMDLALAGERATVVSVEEDDTGRLHYAVTVDADPGRDLGADGTLGLGHRFFFGAEEVEPLEEALDPGPARPRVLVAGIGNIFLGDDAFGVEVVRRLAARPHSRAVKMQDFGIRGLDLVYALQDGYESVVLVDAVARGHAPGTLSVLEVDPPDVGDGEAPPGLLVEGHSMTPERALALAAAMGGPLPRLRVVGCEPAALAAANGDVAPGLSPVVAARLDEAVAMVETEVAALLATPQEASHA